MFPGIIYACRWVWVCICGPNVSWIPSPLGSARLSSAQLCAETWEKSNAKHFSQHSPKSLAITDWESWTRPDFLWQVSLSWLKSRATWMAYWSQLHAPAQTLLSSVQSQCLPPVKRIKTCTPQKRVNFRIKFCGAELINKISRNGRLTRNAGKLGAEIKVDTTTKTPNLRQVPKTFLSFVIFLSSSLRFLLSCVCRVVGRIDSPNGDKIELLNKQ